MEPTPATVGEEQVGNHVKAIDHAGPVVLSVEARDSLDALVSNSTTASKGPRDASPNSGKRPGSHSGALGWFAGKIGFGSTNNETVAQTSGTETHEERLELVGIRQAVAEETTSPQAELVEEVNSPLDSRAMQPDYGSNVEKQIQERELRSPTSSEEPQNRTTEIYKHLHSPLDIRNEPSEHSGFVERHIAEQQSVLEAGNHRRPSNLDLEAPPIDAEELDPSAAASDSSEFQERELSEDQISDADDFESEHVEHVEHADATPGIPKIWMEHVHQDEHDGEGSYSDDGDAYSSDFIDDPGLSPIPEATPEQIAMFEAGLSSKPLEQLVEEQTESESEADLEKALSETREQRHQDFPLPSIDPIDFSSQSLTLQLPNSKWAMDPTSDDFAFATTQLVISEHLSMRNDPQPQCVQLPNGTWAVDPTDDDLLFSVVRVNMAAHEATQFHRSPESSQLTHGRWLVNPTPEDHGFAAVHSAMASHSASRFHQRPEGSQMVNGTWMTDPSEDDFWQAELEVRTRETEYLAAFATATTTHNIDSVSKPALRSWEAQASIDMPTAAPSTLGNSSEDEAKVPNADQDPVKPNQISDVSKPTSSEEASGKPGIPLKSSARDRRSHRVDPVRRYSVDSNPDNDRGPGQFMVNDQFEPISHQEGPEGEWQEADAILNESTAAGRPNDDVFSLYAVNPMGIPAERLLLSSSEESCEQEVPDQRPTEGNLLEEDILNRSIAEPETDSPPADNHSVMEPSVTTYALAAAVQPESVDDEPQYREASREEFTTKQSVDAVSSIDQLARGDSVQESSWGADYHRRPTYRSDTHEAAQFLVDEPEDEYPVYGRRAPILQQYDYFAAASEAQEDPVYYSSAEIYSPSSPTIPPNDKVHSLASSTHPDYIRHEQADATTSSNLSPGYNTTDTESQSFFTPMQSAGVYSPPQYRSYLGEGVHDEQQEQGPLPSPLAGENVTTVHGQDDLFDTDGEDDSEHDTSMEDSAVTMVEYNAPQSVYNLKEHAVVHESEGYVHEPQTATIVHSPLEPSQMPRSPNLTLDTTSQAETASPEDFTPQATKFKLEDNSDVSPLSLRQPPPPVPPPRRRGGLMNSIHNPDRPKTPPSQTAGGEFDINLVPRDVTNIPWRSRTDSTPMSMRSQSTLSSSSPDSPVHAALLADNHEPVIRDSWPTPVRELRGRGDSLTYREADLPYDPSPKPLPFRSDVPSPINTDPAARSHGNSTSTPTQSTLFQKMRAIFENPGAANDSAASSPGPSRPVSGVFHPVRRVKTLGSNSPGYDLVGEDRRASYLDEREDDMDEQSALLASAVGGLNEN